MKKKILLRLLVIISVFTITGCANSKDNIQEEKKEVSLNGAYIIDYENKNYLGDRDKAYMIVIVDIKPNKDILLEDISMTMTVGDKNITGSEYDRTEIVYDSYKSVKSGDSGKIAYIFKMEKYLYKENDSYNIKYKIGTLKGEYSYVIEDSMSFDKKNIKEVDYLEDIVKETYKDNSDDALMILSLKWKINDVYERNDAYKKLDFYNKTNYQCYDWNAVRDGKKILNYFAEGENNNISISNSGFLNVGVENPEKTYDLPTLNYDTLEKYYPGIKELLIELNKITNEYANGLMNVKESGNGTCFRDITISDISSKASPIKTLMDNK